jgi:tRNA1Val (adenine37-N6)-methyltransferase
MEFEFKKFSLDHSQSSMKIGTDAVLLSALAPRIKAGSILDIGTGCGVVAMLMGQFHPQAQITAIDIDESSILQARNIFFLGPFKDRMQAYCVKFQDFAESESNQNKFDFIVSNPPFFVNSLNAKGQSRNRARHNHCLPFEELVSSVCKVATENASVTIILPPEQTFCLTKLFEEKGFQISQQINIYPKQGKPIERIITTYSKNAKQALINHFTIRKIDGTYTEEYQLAVSDILL